ncbi:hypothetical protein [Streptomyces similanensis]|uniref:4Fe-4S ferredoxin-type domain-containing protein n=1 Tax=Streptomyces similanensis TaxID=1274988 RepID=A0ABP9K7I2_9ACTN
MTNGTVATPIPAAPAALRGLTAAVLEVLRLPTRESVTDSQARGADCVWCARGPLNAETAVDLGEQHDETGPGWFPRACRECAAKRAHEGLFAHTPACERCVGEAALCPVGRALYRLVREGRR